MRYVLLIAVVNFLALAVVDDLLGYSLVGGMLGAFFICLFGIPFAIIVGFPALWIARRIKAGSAVTLIPMGVLAGMVTPFVLVMLLGFELTEAMVLVGASLGALSATLWWALVERWPELRTYYD